MKKFFILCLVLDILGVLIILYLERQYLAIFLFAHSYFIFYKIFELLFSKKLDFFCNIIYFYSCTRKYGARHFNFIWNFARFHAEPIAILLFLSSLYFIVKFKSNFQTVSFFSTALIGASLALSVF